MSYQWQKLLGSTWTNISGATSPTFTIASTTTADAGQYRAVVSNSAGNATSNAATLTVNVAGQAPTITQQPSNVTANVGQSAQFSVTATGSAPLSYQWQRLVDTTWTNISGATSATFTISSVATADAGQYRVIVTNSVGSATSNAATLTVNQLPTATISAGATYIFGQTINFSATATDPENGTLPASAYTWRVDFGHDQHFHPHVAEFSGVTGGSFVANFNEPDPDQLYRVILTVRDSNGATFTTTHDVLPVKVQVTLVSNPAGVPLSIDGQSATGPQDSVVGNPRTIQAPPTATVGGTTYAFVSWSDGGAATHVITTPSANTTLTATYTPVAASFAPGLKAEFFDFTTSLSVLPNLTALTPTVVRTDAALNYASTSAAWTGLDSRFADTFASRHTGYLNVPTAGSYTIFVNSDDGSKVWLDGELIINNDGLHSMRELSATRTLTAGNHSLRTEFFENGGGAGLILLWSGPGIAKQVIPAARLVQDAPDGSRLPPGSGRQRPGRHGGRELRRQRRSGRQELEPLRGRGGVLRDRGAAGQSEHWCEQRHRLCREQPAARLPGELRQDGNALRLGPRTRTLRVGRQLTRWAGRGRGRLLGSSRIIPDQLYLDAEHHGWRDRDDQRDNPRHSHRQRVDA